MLLHRTTGIFSPTDSSCFFFGWNLLFVLCTLWHRFEGDPCFKTTSRAVCEQKLFGWLCQHVSANFQGADGISLLVRPSRSFKFESAGVILFRQFGRASCLILARSFSSPSHLSDFQPFDCALVDSQAWWWRTPPQNSSWQTVPTWRMGTSGKVLAMLMVWHWKPGFLMLPPSRCNQWNFHQRATSLATLAIHWPYLLAKSPSEAGLMPLDSR